MNLPSPEQLQRASRGDRQAMEDILVRFLPELRRFIRLRAGAAIRARESSTDLLQSTCREVLQDLTRFEFRGEAQFKKWLYMTALRKILDYDKFHRRERRDVKREAQVPVEEVVQDQASPSQVAMGNEAERRLEEAFDQLPEDYKTVISLSRMIGLDHGEIAETMGRSREAVRVLLHRALARLSVLLQEE